MKRFLFAAIVSAVPMCLVSAQDAKGFCRYPRRLAPDRSETIENLPSVAERASMRNAPSKDHLRRNAIRRRPDWHHGLLRPTTDARTRSRCRQTIGLMKSGSPILSRGWSVRLAVSVALMSGQTLSQRGWARPPSVLIACRGFARSRASIRDRLSILGRPAFSMGYAGDCPTSPISQPYGNDPATDHQ
jgi:hypothetical protein